MAAKAAIKEATEVPVVEGLTRTLFVEDMAGEFKVTIPAEWKVTFGAFQMAGGRYGEHPSGSPALRIYEAENKQRACFVGVRCFRDMSIPLERTVLNGDTISWVEDDGTTRMTQRQDNGRNRQAPVYADEAF